MNQHHDWRVTWSPAHLSDLCERLGNGESYTQIGKAVGRDRSAIAGKVARLKQFDLGPVRTAVITRRISEGRSFDEIAEEIGFPVEAVEFSFAMIRKAMGWQAR